MASTTPVAARAWREVRTGAARPHSTGGELVYAIGDVHGHYDQLRALLALVEADAAVRAAGRRAVLVLLGDYVDRGPRSAEVLEAAVWLRRYAPHEVHLLKGNHEQGLLDFIDDPAAAAGWLKYGADETFASYGVPPLGSEEPSELRRARDDLLERMPAAHLQLLRTLELIVEVGDYVFVHAGIRPNVPLAQQKEDDLLWIRRDFLGYGGDHPKLVVHGHSWQDAEPQVRTNRIGIDTGVYSTETLTGLMLDGEEARYIQVDAGAH